MKLETARILLRPWAESDAFDLYTYASDERVGPKAGWPPHTSIENSLEIIQGVLSKSETYAIILKETKEAIGSIGQMIGDVSNLAIASDEAEVGYWIGVPFWGQGIIQEALDVLLQYAFTTLQIRTMWCAYYHGNIRSAKTQERFGFCYHHTLENVKNDLLGTYLTVHVTRLTYEEWKKQQEEKSMK